MLISELKTGALAASRPKAINPIIASFVKSEIVLNMKGLLPCLAQSVKYFRVSD